MKNKAGKRKKKKKKAATATNTVTDIREIQKVLQKSNDNPCKTCISYGKNEDKVGICTNTGEFTARSNTCVNHKKKKTCSTTASLNA